MVTEVHPGPDGRPDAKGVRDLATRIRRVVHVRAASTSRVHWSTAIRRKGRSAKGFRKLPSGNQAGSLPRGGRCRRDAAKEGTRQGGKSSRC